MNTQEMHTRDNQPRQRPSAHATGRNKGFTLIEMLVVIAILALLISIITPTVNSALHRARTVSCASNMRQISAGMLEYTIANEGRLPRFQRVANEQPLGPSVWAGELIIGGFLDAPLQDSQTDIPANSVLRCPAGLGDQLWNGHLPGDQWTESLMVHRPWGAVQKTESGETKYVHIWYGLNARTEHRPEHGWPFIRNNDQTLYTRITAIKELDRMVMFFDGVWSHNSGATRVYARHGSPRSVTNIAFFDGHVESIRTRPFDVNGSSPDSYPRFRN
ncbi:MAG: prepilin-type N-terminal cleavage/methylation domain-containing protein [Verrucomicrobia bacterium]|nr:prepilin-type N-terminal cleavage/methylation domain-containing protein [Verrucomicrobiota bacterium]MCH8513747.1 type II secretion system GspH family protein [Kiritimatiellia bacterium]